MIGARSIDVTPIDPTAESGASGLCALIGFEKGFEKILKPPSQKKSLSETHAVTRP